MHTKEIVEKKKALHDSSVSDCVYISVLLHVSQISDCQPFADTVIPHTEVYSGTVVSCDPDRLKLIPQAAAFREGGRSALAMGGGGRVGMSGWMKWWMGHVTPTSDGRVSLNVITAIITAYMMNWQKVLTRSALILAVRECVYM